MQDLHHPHSPLGDLPDLVLDNLMDILSSQGGGSGIRATCHLLHDAFDAHNTALVLGGTLKEQKELYEHPGFGSDNELVEFVRGVMSRHPGLKSLKVQSWFNVKNQSSLWSELRDHNEIQHFDLSNNSGAAESFFDPTEVFGRFEYKVPVNLLHMDLSNAYCYHIAPLSACTLLRRLNLKLCSRFNGNLEPLAACVNLQHLDLSRCPNLMDLSPLQACVELQYLDVRWTGVTDLAPLASCKDMRHLNIRNTPVESLGPLAACTRLQHLNLCQTAVSDMHPLAACGLLQHLNLGGTGVRTLVQLKACRDMQHLDLSGCQALEGQWLVGVMAVFTALRHLDLRGSNVRDLNPSDLFKSIKGLNLKV